MFGFLKSKGTKVANIVAGLLYPALHPIKISNGGILPKALMEDDFVIAYMFGAYSMATKLQGVSDADFHASLPIFFQHFFPNEFPSLTQRCINGYQNNSDFKENSRLGAKEFQQMDAGIGRFNSFMEHIKNNY